MIKIITVFTNPDMYNAFFKENQYVNKYDLIPIDNRLENLGLPKRYNDIIETYIDSDSWLLFVHEDLEVKSSLDIIFSLDKNIIYGTFGIKLAGKFPVGYGQHICSNKDGSNPVCAGEKILEPVEVETLDCQSILIHSSLFKRTPPLRFDEVLTFDLYAEDICIHAKNRLAISIYVFPLTCQHYSHGNLTQRYYSGINYLAKKYPDIGV